MQQLNQEKDLLLPILILYGTEPENQETEVLTHPSSLVWVQHWDIVFHSLLKRSCTA